MTMLKKRASYSEEELNLKNGRKWRVTPKPGRKGPEIEFGYECEPAEGDARNTSRGVVKVSLDVKIEEEGQTVIKHLVKELDVGEARTMAAAENLGKRGIRRHVRPLVEKLIAEQYRSSEGS